MKENGDVGVAQDLLPLADKSIDPVVDWVDLGFLLAPLNAPGVDAKRREQLIAQARVLAGENTSASALVDLYEKR